jgi:hypothetical protein
LPQPESFPPLDDLRAYGGKVQHGRPSIAEDRRMLCVRHTPRMAPHAVYAWQRQHQCELCLVYRA